MGSLAVCKGCFFHQSGLVASFPAAGSAFTPVTKPTSDSTRYGGTIQEMDPHTKYFDFSPKTSGDSLLPVKQP